MNIFLKRDCSTLEMEIIEFIKQHNELLTLDEMSEKLKCGIPELKKIMKKYGIVKTRKKKIEYHKKGIEGTLWEKREEYKRKRREIIEKIKTIIKNSDKIFEIEMKECYEMRIINTLEREGKLIVIKIIGNKRIVKIKGDESEWE